MAKIACIYETNPGPIVGGPIPFGETIPYTETNTFEHGCESVRTLYTNWSDVPNFPSAMIGDVRPGAGGLLKRQLPMQHPRGSRQMYAVECNLKQGHGSPLADVGTNLIKFGDVVNDLEGLAEWEVVYRQLPFDVLPDSAVNGVTTELIRFVQREPKFSMESYTLPGNAFAFSSDGKTLPENSNIRRPVMELHYTWYCVPDQVPFSYWYQPPPGNAYPIIGSVNGGDFDGINGNKL